MQGWNIFTHSVRMVFGNLGPALRVSGLLYLAYMIVHTYFVLNFSTVVIEIQTNMSKGIVPAQLPSGLASTVFLNITVNLLASLWIAVLWHRFVLRGELQATIVPPLYLRMVMTYLGKTIQLSLMIMLVVFLLGMLLVVALLPLLGVFANVVVPLLLLGVTLYLSYRLGLVFPAVALGEPMAFKTSWEKTATASGAIIQLAVIAIICVILIQVPSNMNPDPTSVISLLYSYLVGWFVMMVGISVLTTLYGIYVEGREL